MILFLIKSGKMTNIDIISKEEVCVTPLGFTSREFCFKAVNINTYLDKMLHKTVFKENHTCIAMLLQNMAQPQWISLPCNQKLIGDLFCLIHSTINHVTISNDINLSVCNNGVIKKGSNCFEARWHTFTFDQKKVTQNNRDKYHNCTNNIKYLLDLFQYNQKLLIFSNNFQYIVTFRKVLNLYRHTTKPVKDMSKAFVLNIQKTKTFYFPRYLFQFEN